MKFRATILAFILISTTAVFSQQPIATNDQIEQISKDVSKVTNSVDEMNKQMKKFFDTFSTNQGLKLSEKQQRLIFGFEILNRAEQRLATLQSLKLIFIEKQTTIRLQLAQITDDALPQSIDKYVSVRGSTNIEQVKQIRRQALEKEKYELTNALNELQTNIIETNQEINQLESFVKNIRSRIFGEINRELSDL